MKLFKNTVTRSAVVTAVSLALLELFFMVLFVAPDAGNLFDRVSNFAFLYVLAPSLALGIGSGTLTYLLVSKKAKKDWLVGFISSLAAFVVGLVSSALYMVLIVLVFQIA